MPSLDLACDGSFPLPAEEAPAEFVRKLVERSRLFNSSSNPEQRTKTHSRNLIQQATEMFVVMARDMVENTELLQQITSRNLKDHSVLNASVTHLREHAKSFFATELRVLVQLVGASVEKNVPLTLLIRPVGILGYADPKDYGLPPSSTNSTMHGVNPFTPFERHPTMERVQWVNWMPPVDLTNASRRLDQNGMRVYMDRIYTHATDDDAKGNAVRAAWESIVDSNTTLPEVGLRIGYAHGLLHAMHKILYEIFFYDDQLDEIASGGARVLDAAFFPDVSDSDWSFGRSPSRELVARLQRKVKRMARVLNDVLTATSFKNTLLQKGHDTIEIDKESCVLPWVNKYTIVQADGYRRVADASFGSLVQKVKRLYGATCGTEHDVRDTKPPSTVFLSRKRARLVVS